MTMNNWGRTRVSFHVSGSCVGQVLARVHARRHRPSQYHGLHPATLGDRSAAFSQLERGHGGERCQAIDGGRHLVAWWLLAHGQLRLRHQPTGVEGRVGREGGEGAEGTSSLTGAEGGDARESRGEGRDVRPSGAEIQYPVNRLLTQLAPQS